MYLGKEQCGLFVIRLLLFFNELWRSEKQSSTQITRLWLSRYIILPV